MDDLASATGELRTVGEVNNLIIADVSVAYWHLKNGARTIVFIHGNSAGKEAFFKQFEGLAASGYSLLALDLPGHGGSANSKTPETDYNFPAFAFQIKQLLAQLDIISPLIVGWSLGGHVVLEMAGRGFDIAGALIIGTPPMGPGMDDYARAFRPSDAMAVTLKADPTFDDLQCYLSGLYGALLPVPRAFIALAQRMDSAVKTHLGAHWARGDFGCHQRTVAAGWAKPLCVVHGQQDVFVSEPYLEALTWRNLWRGQIQKMPAAGHAPFLEAPETFNALLKDFATDVFSTP